MEDFQKYYSRLKAGICFPRYENDEILEVWVCNELEPYEYLIKLTKAQLKAYSERALTIENWSPNELGVVRIFDERAYIDSEPSYLLDLSLDSMYYGLWIYENELNAAKMPKGEISSLIDAVNLANASENP